MSELRPVHVGSDYVYSYSALSVFWPESEFHAVIARWPRLADHLGLTWDEGPGIGGPYAPYIQSERGEVYRDRRAVARDLKRIYTAQDRDQAERELERFAEQWDANYPMISQSWIENWERIVPFLAFPADVRRIVYTTNTIEALNRQIRKITKTRGHFPSEDSARKLLYLTIINAQKNWRTAYNWSSALAAFRIHFGDRAP